MAPKKKGNKKAQDDWEADLGESITPKDGATAEPKAEEPAAEDDALAGGLMAAIQRRGKKKGKKGADQDWVQGEDPTAEGAEGADNSLANKAPEEANFDDEDVFAGNYKPKKGKAPEEKKAEEPKADDAPRVKTKAEKEKEKKEKEKQRKKEMVFPPLHLHNPSSTDPVVAGRKEESQRAGEGGASEAYRSEARRRCCFTYS